MTDGRLIVVSNRVPSDGPPSGGLVVALHDCLEERGGIWVGTSGKTIAKAENKLTDVDGASYQMKTFDLTPEEHTGYYLNYANSVLWPLCHRRSDLISLHPDAFDAYEGVNRRLAKMLADLCQPNDRIWVHDYHFLPLAQCLREEGVTATIGYFHHIPFPTPQDLQALPEADLFCGWLSSFDLIGLQSEADVSTAYEVLRREEDAGFLPNGDVRYKARQFRIRSFPIGIDAEAFREEALGTDGRALCNLAPGSKLLIGVDRLDYSKGLPSKFKAYGQYLGLRDPKDPTTTLLQIAPPTREKVEAYKQVRQQLERISGRVNGRYAELGWTPINYIHRPIQRAKLAPLYRAASVGLVTPYCDGMNLVAKEYIAAQDPRNPGVLILSQTAGAAEELTEAILVNPYDTKQIAEAIDQALKMPLKERIARQESLSKTVFDHGITEWTQSYLQALRQPLSVAV